MVTVRREQTEYFCQWCPNGHHARCIGDRCACSRAEHAPGIDLGRRMLASAAPDLAPAIMRGVFDRQTEGGTR